jgi:hypothetical protein
MNKTLVSKEANTMTRIEKMMRKENTSRKIKIYMKMVKASHLTKMKTTQKMFYS